MKPVWMTTFGWPHGNCFASSVASVLELGLDDMPAGAIAPKGVEEAEGEWEKPWHKWLEEHNLAFRWYSAWLPKVDGKQKMYAPPGYSILICHVLGAPLMADGTPLRHAVVALDGKIVHNPQPNCTDNSSLSPYAFAVFYVLDASKAFVREGVK